MTSVHAYLTSNFETSIIFSFLCGHRLENVALDGRKTERWFGKKNPQVVPLSPQATEILNRRKKDNHRFSDYVFPGRGKKPYYTDPKDSFRVPVVFDNLIQQ